MAKRKGQEPQELMLKFKADQPTMEVVHGEFAGSVFVPGEAYPESAVPYYYRHKFEVVTTVEKSSEENLTKEEHTDEEQASYT